MRSSKRVFLGNIFGQELQGPVAGRWASPLKELTSVCLASRLQPPVCVCGGGWGVTMPGEPSGHPGPLRWEERLFKT